MPRVVLDPGHTLTRGVSPPDTGKIGGCNSAGNHSGAVPLQYLAICSSLRSSSATVFSILRYLLLRIRPTCNVTGGRGVGMVAASPSPALRIGTLLCAVLIDGIEEPPAITP